MCVYNNMAARGSHVVITVHFAALRSRSSSCHISFNAIVLSLAGECFYSNNIGFKYERSTSVVLFINVGIAESEWRAKLEDDQWELD